MNPYHVLLHTHRPVAFFSQKQRLHWLAAYILKSAKKPACMPDVFVRETFCHFDQALSDELPKDSMDVEPFLKAKT